MYHQFNIHNSMFSPHTVFMCFVWIWEQTAIISLYNINWLVFYNRDLNYVLLGACAKSQKRLLASLCLSVRPHGTNWVPLEGFSWYFIIENFSKIYRENSRFFFNVPRLTGSLHEDLCTFMIISCPILLRIRSVLDNTCIENKNTLFLFRNFSESHSV